MPRVNSSGDNYQFNDPIQRMRSQGGVGGGVFDQGYAHPTAGRSLPNDPAIANAIPQNRGPMNFTRFELEQALMAAQNQQRHQQQQFANLQQQQHQNSFLSQQSYRTGGGIPTPNLHPSKLVRIFLHFSPICFVCYFCVLNNACYM